MIDSSRLDAGVEALLVAATYRSDALHLRAIAAVLMLLRLVGR